MSLLSPVTCHSNKKYYSISFIIIAKVTVTIVTIVTNYIFNK